MYLTNVFNIYINQNQLKAAGAKKLKMSKLYDVCHQSKQNNHELNTII